MSLIYVLDIKPSLLYAKVNGTLIIKFMQPFPLFALGNIMMLEMHLELLNNALYQQLFKLPSVDKSNQILIR
jgi:hypothetical protein